MFVVEGGRRLVVWVRGHGRRRAISMSKTKKMTARRKNRIENGRRALFLGSNPHSNGDDFSWSREEREERREVIRRRREVRVRATRKVRVGWSMGQGNGNSWEGLQSSACLSHLAERNYIGCL